MPGADILWLERTRGDLRSQCLHAVHDLLPPAIGQRNTQRHAGVGGGDGLGLIEQAFDIRRKVVLAANDTNADPGFVQLADLGGEVGLEQPHEQADFFSRAAPVLGRKAVDGQGFQPDFVGSANQSAGRFHPLLMAEVPGHATNLRPAPVAVHDHRHVPRQAILWYSSEGVGHGHAA